MASSNENSKKELKRSKSGLRMLSCDDSKSSPFLLDEPPWVSDEEVSACQKCGKKFDFMNRRHHCRRCGKIFCDKDTKHKYALPRLSFVDPVRLCEMCGPVTMRENEFFTKHLKVLTSGVSMMVTSTAFDSSTEPIRFQVRLSSSHRFVEFKSGEGELSSIDIGQISKLQIQTNESDRGTTVASGISLTYTDLQGHEQTTSLNACVDGRKPTGAWIIALQKGMKLIFSSRNTSSID